MSPQKPRGTVSIRSCSCRRAEGKIQLSLTIDNESDRPCFIIPRIRRVHLDRASGVLSVWFAVTPPGDEASPLRMEFTAPRTEAIREHASKTLTASLPEDMTRLVPHADGSFHLEAIDLTRATAVEVHAAVDDKPFYLSPTKGNYRLQAAGWGREVTARARIEPPGGGEDAPAAQRKLPRGKR